MAVDSDFLIARDGLRMYYRFWTPEKTKKVLCICHGLAEHSGRYHRLAQHLMNYGIGVYCLDLRGHGKSEGKRGHAKNMDIILNDIEELMKAARVKHLEAPIYLFGHSMGGNFVANYMIEKDTKEVSGFILSAPWLKLRFNPPAWKLKTGLLIGKIWPGFSTDNGLDPSKLSRIVSEVEKYIADPMIHPKITASLYRLISEGSLSALKSAPAIKKPGLIYHGTSDEITDWETSKQFALSNDRFDWYSIDGSYHEPHNDKEREGVQQMISDWLGKN